MLSTSGNLPIQNVGEDFSKLLSFKLKRGDDKKSISIRPPPCGSLFRSCPPSVFDPADKKKNAKCNFVY
ncbi:hypothetical protein Y032_0576g207 [Ancylostoma ceylanicum]|uniref:Uncharacterized protein n=1 Tax=Ancylostoma ceylanicum TaxID=53326 RepID=A0A016WQC3_9BILA|nr:hypothetical protein Y032_0576g207 [Ancylostoma ceylanicum]